MTVLSKDQAFACLDCLKITLLLSTLLLMIEISGKSPHLAQESQFYGKATKKQS